MKLMCVITGACIALIGTILSAWPRLVLEVANNMLALPEAIGDDVYHTIVKVLAVVVGYVLFPIVGGAIGFVVGYILVRKLD